MNYHTAEKLTLYGALSRFEYLNPVSARQIRPDGGNSSVPDTAFL